MENSGEQVQEYRDNCMRAVAARTTLVWTQLRSLMYAHRDRLEVDPYLFSSMQINARRLEEALDAAICAGLIEEIITDRPDAWVLHAGFVESLVWAAELEKKEREAVDNWMKQKYLFGLVRLIELCLNYKEPLFPSRLSAILARQIEGLQREAWYELTDPSGA